MTAALPHRWLGRVPYRAGRDLQEARRERLLAGDAGAACLLLCEHDPVITLGRRADRNHVLANPRTLAAHGVEVVATNRGGDVTYHGPGQLMIYPVVELRRGIVAYLEAIASALATLAAELGVCDATWRRDPAGLWINDAKLAACGIHVRRRVVVHGWALNVDTPPEAWRWIVPCGLGDARVTSLAEQRAKRKLPPPPPMSELAERAAGHLCRALEPVTMNRCRPTAQSPVASSSCTTAITTKS